MNKETRTNIESAIYELTILHDRLNPSERSWTDRQIKHIRKFLRDAIEVEDGLHDAKLLWNYDNAREKQMSGLCNECLLIKELCTCGITEEQLKHIETILENILAEYTPGTNKAVSEVFAEIRRLQQQVKEQQDQLDKVVYINEKGEPKITTKELAILLTDFEILQQQAQKMKEVLRFYGDVDNYVELKGFLGQTYTASIIKDEGEKARSILEEMEDNP